MIIREKTRRAASPLPGVSLAKASSSPLRHSTVALASAAAAQIELRRQTGGFNLLSAKEVQPGVLVFRLRDQTGRANFIGCNADHHSLAFGRVGGTALNHVAFDIGDLDGEMRAAGRMKRDDTTLIALW